MEERVILFTDVHHFSIVFTTLAENTYIFLQEMYEELGDIIVDHEGEILKYLGDGMLCGFPAGCENEAVECSLKMRKAFAAMVRRTGLPSEIELEVGIGSGSVAAGDFGHRSFRQRDYVGEEINRVAMIGHFQGIAVTERVYEKLNTNYETLRLPDVTMKRQAEPLKIWAVAEPPGKNAKEKETENG